MRIVKPLKPSEASRVKTLGVHAILAPSLVSMLDRRKTKQMLQVNQKRPTMEVAEDLCFTIRAYFQEIEDDMDG